MNLSAAAKVLPLTVVLSLSACSSENTDNAAHLMTTLTSAYAVAGGPWSKIPNPSVPGTFVRSVLPSGTVTQATVNGTGNNSATWTTGGLTRGYWKLEFLYPASFNNAKCVKILYKRTFETGFSNFGTFAFDQSLGAVTSPVYSTRAWPPATLSIPNQFWIETNNSTMNNGMLAIRINDRGCSVGKIVADTIRLTPMSTVRNPSSPFVWQR